MFCKASGRRVEVGRMEAAGADTANGGSAQPSVSSRQVVFKVGPRVPPHPMISSDGLTLQARIGGDHGHDL
jgi:hypothetical protein